MWDSTFCQGCTADLDIPSWSVWLFCGQNNLMAFYWCSGYFIKGQQYNVITHLVQQAWQQFIVVRAPVTAAAIPSLMLPKLAYVMRISPPSPCLVNIIDYKGGSSSSSRLVQGHEGHATQIM